jgi:hypothetical protein
MLEAMSDKRTALRAKSDDADGLHGRPPFGFSLSSTPTSLLVAQMAYDIPRSSRLAAALESANGAVHPAITGHSAHV